MMDLTRAQRYAVARQWGLWRRWLAYERHERSVGRPIPDRAVLHRLLTAIREEMRDDAVR